MASHTQRINDSSNEESAINLNGHQLFPNPPPRMREHRNQLILSVIPIVHRFRPMNLVITLIVPGPRIVDAMALTRFLQPLVAEIEGLDGEESLVDTSSTIT